MSGNKKYLLQSLMNIDGKSLMAFDWFESEEELREFVKQLKKGPNPVIRQIFNALIIHSCEDIKDL